MSFKAQDNDLQEFEEILCLSRGSDTDIFKCGVIPPRLANLECPFSWKYDFTNDNRDIVDIVEGKLLEMHDEVGLLECWKRYVLNLILCHEYANSGELEEAEQKLILCNAILDDQCDVEDSPSITAMGCGLKHIILACKCFLLYASQLHDEVQNTLDMIVPFEDLQNREKASILCVKGSYCSEFGYKGITESIALIEKAVLMDGECAEWRFLLGRSLGRLRRIEKRSAIPDKQELSVLESAVEMSSNASFMVLLAQTYRETARNVHIEKKRELRVFKPYSDSLNQKSLELYRKVLQQDTTNVNILVRLALGFMKLPNPWRDLGDAKRCILKALHKAPKNPMANHVAGTYFSTVKDYRQAMEYYSKASAYNVFGADIDLINLKMKLNASYVPVADLERLLDVFKEKPHQEATLCHLGSYYYTKEKDFKRALKYWLQVIEMDINSEKLRVFYNARTSHPALCINKVVITEIMKLLDTEHVSELERQLYDRIISKYIEHHPGLIITVTDIDISKYRNRAFEHRRWRNGAFSKNNLSKNSGPSTSKEDKAPSGSRSQDIAFLSSRTPVYGNACKGPFRGKVSASTSKSRPRGHHPRNPEEQLCSGAMGRARGTNAHVTKTTTPQLEKK